jgi:hypothetical protein
LFFFCCQFVLDYFRFFLKKTIVCANLSWNNKIRDESKFANDPRFRTNKTHWNYRLPPITGAILKQTQSLLFTSLLKLRIESIHPNAFENMNSLVSLTFTNVILPILNANAFISLPLLKHLRLTSCKIKVLDPNCFDGLYLLKSLVMSFNQIVSLAPEQFSDLHELEELDLSYNELVHFDRQTFSPLAKFRNLELNNNVCDTIYAELFTNLESIEVITLNSTIFMRSNGFPYRCKYKIYWRGILITLEEFRALLDRRYGRKIRFGYFGYPINEEYSEASTEYTEGQSQVVNEESFFGTFDEPSITATEISSTQQTSSQQQQQPSSQEAKRSLLTSICDDSFGSALSSQTCDSFSSLCHRRQATLSARLCHRRQATLSARLCQRRHLTSYFHKIVAAKQMPSSMMTIVMMIQTVTLL